MGPYTLAEKCKHTHMTVRVLVLKVQNIQAGTVLGKVSGDTAACVCMDTHVPMCFLECVLDQHPYLISYIKRENA